MESIAISIRCLGLTLLIVLAQAASAEKRALLVGVSAYEHLTPEKQLRGPMNDVPLLRDVIVERGFSNANIRILADGVAGAELPTRLNILNAMTALVDSSKPGDFVIIYMAGHGSQMPTDGDVPVGYRKADGRQEMFLARDVREWDRNLKRVPNAIVDYELPQFVERIRDKGAFVWAIFDACHSATLVRGSEEGPDIRQRTVSPVDLGIPASEFGSADDDQAIETSGMLISGAGVTTRGGAASGRSPAMGGYVAFYAAEQHEVTVEDRLPEEDPARVPRGLFSYWLTSALKSVDGGASYRQLGSYVLNRYSSKNRRIPTPQFTGTHLDAPLFGDALSERVRQWPITSGIDGLTIPAGLLEQVGDFAVLSVLRSPLAKDGELLGYVRASQPALTHAKLVPIAHAGWPALNPSALPRGSTARLLRPAVDFVLRVASPEFRAGSKEVAAQVVIDKARALLPSGLRVAWVKPSEPHDLRLEASNGRLWLVPPGTRPSNGGAYLAPAVETSGSDASIQLRDGLVRVSKALNLQRIATALDAAANARNLKVTAEVERRGKRTPLNPAAVSELRDDDRVFVTVQNLNPRVAVDVTALYIDDRYGIDALAAGSVEGSTGRMPANDNSSGGSRLTFDFGISTTTTGLERMVIIAVEAVSGQERFDFSYLKQDRLSDVTRSGRDDTRALFDQAGFGSEADGEGAALTRSAFAPARTQMEILSFRVVPEAARRRRASGPQ